MNLGVGFERQAAHLIDRAAQQCSHLVNKSPRTPRTVAAHAHIGQRTLREKNHFGIFTANIYEGFNLRIYAAYKVCRRDHLLLERQQKTFGNTHPGRARYCQQQKAFAYLFACLAEKRSRSPQYIGMMTLICGVEDGSRLIDQHQFGGRRAHVQTGPNSRFVCHGHSSTRTVYTSGAKINKNLRNMPCTDYTQIGIQE